VKNCSGLVYFAAPWANAKLSCHSSSSGKCPSDKTLT